MTDFDPPQNSPNNPLMPVKQQQPRVEYLYIAIWVILFLGIAGSVVEESALPFFAAIPLCLLLCGLGTIANLLVKILNELKK